MEIANCKDSLKNQLFGYPFKFLKQSCQFKRKKKFLQMNDPVTLSVSTDINSVLHIGVIEHCNEDHSVSSITGIFCQIYSH